MEYYTELAEFQARYLIGVHVPDGVSVRLTCVSTPEQYDVLRGDRLIGYIRFRHAKLRVQYPYVGGETLFEEQWPGDEYRSEWDTQDQRAHDLSRFLEMLVKRDDQR